MRSTRLLLAALALASAATAQTPAAELKNAQNATVLRADADGSLLLPNTYVNPVSGSFVPGPIPATGIGGRFMWYAGRHALRAGYQQFAINGLADSVGVASAAFGYSTKASGGYSFAAGHLAYATGDFATALGVEVRAGGAGAFAGGYQAQASGAAATAFGRSTLAGGDWSTALGHSTVASGVGATALGRNTDATGNAALAIGNLTTASGGNAFASGYLTTASGDAAAAFGYETDATGTQSFAAGRAATASGFVAIALGNGAEASGEYSVAVGSFANTNGKDGAVVIADGSSTDDVLAQANNQFVVRAQRIWLGASNNVTATVNRYLETSTGAHLTFGGAWTNSSDSTRKENFRPVDAEATLARLAALRVTRWNYRSEGPGIDHVGPMAQSFHAAFGLGADDRSIATVDADGVLMLAVQALEARTTALADANAALRARTDRLEALVARLAAAPAATPAGAGRRP